MVWPNVDWWRALDAGASWVQGKRHVVLDVIDCGELVAPTGRLVVCDPFTGLLAENNPIIPIPPGRYQVKVTLADVSGKADGSHIREAYATLILSDAPEVERRVLQALQAGEEPKDLEPREFVGFRVDAGTACFIDEGALETGMPPEGEWYDDIFENSDPECWFNRLDDPEHIRAGIAIVPLPLATDGSNAILIHSGWGDGVYAIVGGYDAEGRLVRVHIDFNVVFAADPVDGASDPVEAAAS